MIQELRIKGVGVIEEASLELSPGFTVITGETGAGKTMILNSLRLLMGQKGDSDLVRVGHPRIEVDGIFQTSAESRLVLETLGIDAGEEMILSRTVPASGRSRAVVEGRPVPLKVLDDLVSPLVTIHGQSDQWRVRQEKVQRDFLDTYAGPQHLKDVEAYRKLWEEAFALTRRLDMIRAEHDQREIEAAYLSELVESIGNLGLKADEEEELQGQIDRLSYAADITEALTEAGRNLRGADSMMGALDRIGTALTFVREAAELDADLVENETRLEQLEAEVLDVADEMRNYLERLHEDPEELELLLQRRADIEALMKGRATSIPELLQWEESSRARLVELSGEAFNQDAIAAKLQHVQKQLEQLGQKLRGVRNSAGIRLAAAVNHELSALAMNQATFRVQVRESRLQASGADEITMELQPRPEAPFKGLGEGASGGEISRVMLALEVALGEQSEPGTYIFDEVDQGVGGRTALEIGRRLAKLAENQQVIAVTHLPQVAAFADLHLVLRRNGTQTTVEAAAGSDRVAEIVRMLGGDKNSVTARRHAEELLSEKSWEDQERKKELD